MSLMKYMFDNDWMQRGDIEALRNRSRTADRTARRRNRQTDDRIDDLENEVAELALLSRVLLTMLHESNVIDPNQFGEVMRRIDAEDGVIDGKITPEADRPQPPKPPLAAPKPRRKR